MIIIPKLKRYKIFACPDCRKKFVSLVALNVHYKKRHPEKQLRFYLNKKNQGMAKSTRKPVRPIVKS